MLLSDAPGWAEGPNRPPVSPTVPAGVWKPSAKDYGAFSEAAAKRYSGTFPDPLNPGQLLPRVTDWQGWNEPNLNIYLTPQWTRSAASSTMPAPTPSAPMMNAFYTGIKAASTSNLVVTAGTSPFGDPPACSASASPRRASGRTSSASRRTLRKRALLGLADPLRRARPPPVPDRPARAATPPTPTTW